MLTLVHFGPADFDILTAPTWEPSRCIYASKGNGVTDYVAKRACIDNAIGTSAYLWCYRVGSSGPAMVWREQPARWTLHVQPTRVLGFVRESVWHGVIANNADPSLNEYFAHECPATWDATREAVSILVPWPLRGGEVCRWDLFAPGAYLPARPLQSRTYRCAMRCNHG